MTAIQRNIRYRGKGFFYPGIFDLRPWKVNRGSICIKLGSLDRRTSLTAMVPHNGVMTAMATFFFVCPLMGLGAFGGRSPERIKASITPLANHFFYGVGLAIGIVLI